MKQNGIFKVMAAVVMAMVNKAKVFFDTPTESFGASGRVSNGRQAFYAVSAHTYGSKKKRYF